MTKYTIGFALIAGLALAAAASFHLGQSDKIELVSGCTTSYGQTLDAAGAPVSVETLTCPRPSAIRVALHNHLWLWG